MRRSVLKKKKRPRKKRKGGWVDRAESEDRMCQGKRGTEIPMTMGYKIV